MIPIGLPTITLPGFVIQPLGINVGINSTFPKSFTVFTLELILKSVFQLKLFFFIFTVLKLNSKPLFSTDPRFNHCELNPVCAGIGASISMSSVNLL